MNRLAIISTMAGVDWGGSEELWADLAVEALGAGCTVGLFLNRPSSRSLPRRVIALQSAGAEVYLRRVPLSGRLERAGALYRWYSRIARPFGPLFRFHPDVAFFSLGTTGSCVSLYDAGDVPGRLRERKIPYALVTQLHGEDGPPSDRERQRTLDFFRGAFLAAFVSERNRETLRRQLADPLPEAVVVRNPVNLADRSIVPWPATDGDPAGATVFMACVARLETSHKGQDLLFSALAAPAWRERNWRLRLYGEGRHRDYLAALSRYFGIADRVDLVGHASDIRKVWADNHLLVLPSRVEGTPLALVEAMLCGRPAVVTDVGGNAEWIREGSTGFVAEAPTAPLIAAALERAWNARTQWQEIGQRAHELATERTRVAPGKALFQLLNTHARSCAAVARASSP